MGPGAMENVSASLQAKVDALSRPASYPGNPPVEVIETHMSWVFLAGQTVYKLKKPVRYEQMDFTSLGARHFYCMEEVRLNQPLAASVYLGVVALRADEAGTLSLGGAGTAVEWLVSMRRLSARRMLDSMLENRLATADDMSRVAQRLAAFYASLEPALIGPQAYRERLGRDIDQCEAELCDPAFGLAGDEIRRLCAQMRSVLLRRPGVFDARVLAGRIVEGHGDLRPDHVYLGTPVAIIDRLEFSTELRTLDALDEVALLALECERLGAAELGRVLIDAYRVSAGDDGAAGLVHFHQCRRACIRARLTIRHLRERQYRRSPKWAARTLHYLQLAGLHMHACDAALAD